MPSEINQRKKIFYDYHLYVESKKAKLMETEQNDGYQEWGWGDIKGYKLPVSSERSKVQHGDYSKQYCILERC